jgi:hypothetical protein
MKKLRADKLRECLLPFCSESSSCLLSENLKIKIYKTIISLDVRGVKYGPSH